MEYRNKYFSIISGKNNVTKYKGELIFTRIHIIGNNNIVFIDDNSIIRNARIFINGDNNVITINKRTDLECTELYVQGNHCIVEIGTDNHIGKSHLAVTEENISLMIGNNCMISDNIQIRTGDSHSIFDGNGNRTNNAKSINIGNHVWLGEGCKILKGVTLEDDVVVGTGAIVTKSFSSNVLISGVPARIIKENISWNHKR